MRLTNVDFIFGPQSKQQEQQQQTKQQQTRQNRQNKTDKTKQTAGNNQQQTTRKPKMSSSGWSEIDASNTTLKGSAANDRFGFDVALSSSGQRLAVASQRTNSSRGSVQVYDLGSESTWSSVGSSFPPSTELDSGSRLSAIAMSADGTRIVYGAARHDFDSTNQCGHGKIGVYRYNSSSSSWVSVGSEEGEDQTNTSDREKLGTSVAISSDGTRIAVGAPNYKDFNPIDAHPSITSYSSAGRVLIFSVSDSALTQIGIQNGQRGRSNNEELGQSVGLSSDGTYMIASSSNLSNGMTRIHKWNTSTSRYNQQIAIEGSNNSNLGFRCGINGDGDVAFTVSQTDAEIKIYTRGGTDGETWTERSDTWPSSTEASWRTGASNKLIRDVTFNSDGTVIAITANDYNVQSKCFVYQYNSSNTTWELVDAEINPMDDTNFGISNNSVALSSTGEYVAMGMPGAVVDATNNVGRSFVFQNSSLASSSGESGGGESGGGGGGGFIMIKNTGSFQVAGTGAITVK